MLITRTKANCIENCKNYFSISHALLTHRYKSLLSSFDTRQLWKLFAIDSIMDILIFNKTLLKVLAIWPTETFAFANWTISRLIRYVGLLLLFVVTITSCVAYSIQNIDDIVECTSAMYVSLAFTTSVCTYCALIYHRERIQLVLTKIQAIVMIRKKSFPIPFMCIFWARFVLPDMVLIFSFKGTSGGSNLVASGSRPLYENIEFSYTSMCKRFVHYWIVIVGAFSVFLIAVPVYYVIMGRSDVENWNPAYKTVYVQFIYIWCLFTYKIPEFRKWSNFIIEFHVMRIDEQSSIRIVWRPYIFRSVVVPHFSHICTFRNLLGDWYVSHWYCAVRVNDVDRYWSHHLKHKVSNCRTVTASSEHKEVTAISSRQISWRINWNSRIIEGDHVGRTLR